MGGAATHPQQQLNLPQSPDDFSPRRASIRPRPLPLPLSHLFSRGSAVEVQTDEEDFKGVLFSATVIDPPAPFTSKHSKRRSKKLYVEYHNLLAREDGSERLREFVGLSCVRPLPPSAPSVKPFEPGDVVDAFYKDGWWTGVVKHALQGGEKYIVTFQHPPDELEFGVSELRVHLDWVNGSWVCPQKQSIAGLMFDIGRKVEVSLDRENCQDAWFPATIHKHLENGAYVVESTNNDNKVQALKVTINYPYIRPCPPFLKDKNFFLLEKVDAWFDFGWWTGVITKELENGRYIVFFKQLKRDKEFHQSDLRPHMEWKDGKWFTSSQDVPIWSSDACMHEQHTPETFSASAVTIPLSSVDDKQDTCDQITLSLGTTEKGHSDEMSPVDQKVSHVTASLIKRGQRVAVAQSALSQPTQKLDEGNVVRDQFTHDSSSKDTIYGSVSPVSLNNISSSATQTVSGDHLSDSPSLGRRTRRKQRNSDATLNVGKKDNSTPSMTGIQMLPLGSLNHDVGGKELDLVENTAHIRNEHAQNETELHVIIGLPCAEMGSSEFGKQGKRGCHSNCKEILNPASDKNQLLNESTDKKTKDNKQLEIGELVEKKKRGRPKKSLVDGIQTALSGNAQNGVVGSDDLNRKDDGSHSIPEVKVMEVNSSLPAQEVVQNENKSTDEHSDPKKERGSKRRRILSRKLVEQVVNSPRRQGTNSSGRGRRLVLGSKVARQVIDSPDVSGGKMKEANQAMETEVVICEALNTELDDEPLSKWIQGRHSPSVTEGSRLSPVRTMAQCMENGRNKGDGIMLEDSEKQPKSGIDASASANADSIAWSDPQNLPFVKNTVLWKTIESMEVFQRIPQKPHFKPLENFKESAREGLAIGYMVTFSSVVEKTSRLQFDDPKSVTDDILETLADLERHGFEVKTVLDRVNELVAAKEKQEKLVDEVKVLNNQMSEHNHQRSRIEEEIKEINEDMRKLQEKLSLAESAKEKQDGEISSLQAKLKETEEIIKNVGREFEGIASSVLGKV